MTLYDFIDCHYGANGDAELRKILASGQDVNGRFGDLSETALHVAARRRRKSAVKILLALGADIDARNAAGKTAYAHALRRSFHDITEVLEDHGADTSLTAADQFAVAIGERRLDEAREILAANLEVIRTGNVEEDRLLGDIAGRNDSEGVQFLIEAGAPLTVSALDEGTPLHIAAWFGQTENVRLLLAAGAPVNAWEKYHHSSPLGWAVHGARFSGGAGERQNEYLEIVDLLLEAGAELHYAGEPDSDDFMGRLLSDAPPRVAERLKAERLKKAR